jgi:hypothetical protein
MWVLLLPLAELLTLYMNFISLGVLFVSRLLVRESTTAAAATAEPSTFSLLFYSQVGKSGRSTQVLLHFLQMSFRISLLISKKYSFVII